MCAMANPNVLVVAIEEDKVKVEEKFPKKKFDFEFYDDDALPRETEVFNCGEQLSKYHKFVFVISRESLENDKMRLYRAMAPEDKITVPYIIDESLPDDYIDPIVRRLGCIRCPEKLMKCLETRPADCVHRLPIAHLYPGLVANFYFGFLEFVLPSLKDKLKTWRDRQKVPVVEKMLILIPKSCKCEGFLEDYDRKHISLYTDEEGKGSEEDSKVECDPNPRIPKTFRSYNQRMYRVKNPDNPSEEYFVVLVLCATIHALYELADDPDCAINKKELLDEERPLFRDMLKKMLDEKKDCKGKAEVREFNDGEGNSNNDLAKVIVDACKNMPKLS